MLPTTLDVLKAATRADVTLDPAARARIIAAIQAAASPTAAQPKAAVDRLMRRAEAARVLQRSPRAVDMLATQGHLRRVKMPGRVRSGGFLASDVLALIGG